MQRGWLTAVMVTVAGLILAAALWFWGFHRPDAMIASPAPSQTPQLASTERPEAWATAGDLPSAWQPKTPTRTSSRTATPSPTATATTLATAGSSATPVPLSPTIALSPTPTRTPIHRPTDRDPNRLTIPAIGLDTSVVTVSVETVSDGNGGTKTQWQVADYAAGFHRGTARIGHIGNTVIAGHNNIRGDVFKDLYKVEPGDDIFLWLDDWAFRYKVSASYRLPVQGAPESVLQDNLKWILPTDDQRLTLLTCWPPFSNSHRLVVVAYPVSWAD